MGYLVNPFKYISNKYFFVTPLFYSYGNAAEELLWASARAKVLGRKLVVIAPARYTQILGFSICNSELFNLDFGYQFNSIEKIVKYIIVFIVNLIFFFKRLLALTLKKYFKYSLHERYFFPQIGRYSYWPAVHVNDNNLKKYGEDPILKELLSITPPTVNLKNKTQKSAVFDELMLQIDSKYVCLHVRDFAYHSDSHKRSYRNADINNYIPAIQMLIDEGYAIIRIGDKSMQKCNFANDKFIELCKLKYQSELLDLLIIQHCEFFIGMQSGPLDVAQLFQKPILILNMYTWFFATPFKPNDRGLLKNLIIKDIGEVNSLTKRFNLPYKFTDSVEILSNEEVTFVENSPFEILEATKLFYNEYLLEFSNELNEGMLSNRDLYRLSSKKILKKFLSFDNIRPHENEINRIIYRELSSFGIFYTNPSYKKKSIKNYLN